MKRNSRNADGARSIFELVVLRKGLTKPKVDSRKSKDFKIVGPGSLSDPDFEKKTKDTKDLTLAEMVRLKLKERGVEI